MWNTKEAQFVLKGNTVVHPPVRTDGLELYYDVKGKKNSDLHKDKLLDMSGNSRHGELQSFSYKNLSGYQEDSELVFDGIDDTLKMPKLNGIDIDSFTYQLNNNIISYGEGGTIKWVKDGNVMERKGINLFKDSQELKLKGYANSYMATDKIYLKKGHKYYVSRDYQKIDGTYNAIVGRVTSTIDGKLVTIIRGEGENYQPSGVYTHAGESGYSSFYLYGPHKVGENGKSLAIFRNVQLIDLTATFGAGNEPTFEEIQAEPDKWQWLPNPMDLLESKDLKGNILGDMEDIVDASPRDRQSGKEVFTEHADDSHVEVEVDGKSYQHAGSGKNLINESMLINNANISISTGEIISGSRTILKEPIKVKPNTYYTLTRPTSSGNIGLRLYTYDGTYLGSGAGFVAGYYFTFSTPADCELFSFIDESNTLSAGYQLEEGSTATEYELPAPSPDYPIEIHSLNDFDVVSSRTKRNYILNSKQNFTTQTSKRVDLSKDLTISLIKEYGFTGSIDIEVVNHKILENYSFNRLGFELGIKYNSGTIGYHQTDIYPNGEDFKGRVSRYFSPREVWSELVSCTVWIQTGGDKVYIGNPKITIGDNTQDVWTPAPEDITPDTGHPLIDKVNLNLTEPSRSAGDVKDRIFRDRNGLWKIERNVGKMVLDGSESWARNTSKRFYVQNSSIRNIDRSKEGAISNQYKSGRKDIDWNNQDTVIQNTDSGRLYFVTKKEYSTLDDWKNYIRSEFDNNTPVVVHYEVASPVIETLDKELQDQLNTLKSFKGSNYIYTIINEVDGLPDYISENLKPNLHTDFLARDHYKESRTVNNLLIWNRSLEDEELLSQNKLFHERFNMRSNTIKGEPINQEINLLNGGVFGHSLEQNYTIEI